jgi:hypothetical protein
MIEMTLHEVLFEVIIGLSSKINKKALKRAIEEHQGDYNHTLKRYYDLAHYIKEDNRIWYDFIWLESEEDYNYIKSLHYPPKRYKKLYNYKRGELEPIRQKDTRFGMEVSNGYYHRFSYLFDVYQYIEMNDIHVID